MIQRPLTCLLIVTALLCLVGPAQAGSSKKGGGPDLPPTRQDITCVGFSANGKEVVFRIIDENIGTLFQV